MKKKHSQIPSDVECAILFEVPYDIVRGQFSDPSTELMSMLISELTHYNAKYNWAIAYHEHDKMKLLRHSLPETINETVKRLYGKIGTDFAVPHKNIRKMFQAYHSISQSAGIPYIMFGHIGSSHIHLNYLPKNKQQLKIAKIAYTKLAKTAIKLKGTISAEHGVGKKTVLSNQEKHIPYLELLYGKKGLKIIANIKKSFDPNNILNIGNIIP